MEPIAAFGGSDNRSMAADNTSAFNCRYAVAAGPKRWSVHAYGEAIDVDPLENPYLLGGDRLPAGRPAVPRPGGRAPRDGGAREAHSSRPSRASAGSGAGGGRVPGLPAFLVERRADGSHLTAGGRCERVLASSPVGPRVRGTWRFKTSVHAPSFRPRAEAQAVPPVGATLEPQAEWTDGTPTRSGAGP